MTTLNFPKIEEFERNYSISKTTKVQLEWNFAEISKSKALKEIKEAIKKFSLEGTIDY